MTENKATWHQNSPFDASEYTHEKWLNGVERVLDGADFNKTLVTKTPDGIEIQPLYSQQTRAPFQSHGQSGNTGGNTKSHWSIVQSYVHGGIKEVNLQILSDLAGGLSGVELTLSSQQAKSTALPCYGVEQLEQLLKSVHPQMIQLSLSPGAENTVCGALVLAYYYRQKISAEKIHGALNIDPLGALATTGKAVESPLSDVAQFASHCATHFPNVTSLCADSSIYHNAGCTEAQELAYLISTAVAYLRGQVEHTPSTINIDTAFTQIRFRLALDCDYFMSVAKLRAARELINQVATYCGATAPHVNIDTVTGTRSLTELDAATNILRNTTQAAAAMAGGANSYNCAAYDLLTENSTKARRLARNTHHILIEESGLLEVNDPARGAGYVEALTESLCETAWTIFQKIESQGGMHQALLNGSIANQIKTAKYKRTAALANGQSAIVGVTDYPSISDQVISKTNKVGDESSTNDQTDQSKVSVTALIGSLSDGESTFEYHAAYCNSSTVVAPINGFRDAEIFEQLRARSDHYLSQQGKRPTIDLITLGSQKEYAGRATFCKNFFAIAGIDTRKIDFQEYVSNTLATPKSQLAVLCSSDKRYLTDAADAGDSLNGQPLWIAGNHPEATKGLDKHGITKQIHLHCDRVMLLESALTLLGAE